VEVDELASFTGGGETQLVNDLPEESLRVPPPHHGTSHRGFPDTLLYLWLSEGVEDWVSLEVNRDVLSGQSLVDGLDDFDFVLQEFLVASIQSDLDDTGTVDSDSGSLGDDGAWSDQILENALMDGSKGS